jgi:hypothetical protein
MNTTDQIATDMIAYLAEKADNEILPLCWSWSYNNSANVSAAIRKLHAAGKIARSPRNEKIWVQA